MGPSVQPIDSPLSLSPPRRPRARVLTGSSRPCSTLEPSSPAAPRAPSRRPCQSPSAASSRSSGVLSKLLWSAIPTVLSKVNLDDPGYMYRGTALLSATSPLAPALTTNACPPPRIAAPAVLLLGEQLPERIRTALPAPGLLLHLGTGLAVREAVSGGTESLCVGPSCGGGRHHWVELRHVTQQRDAQQATPGGPSSVCPPPGAATHAIFKVSW